MTRITTMKLNALCGICGELMRDLGEWPITYPRKENHTAAHTLQARRFSCRTCRAPPNNAEQYAGGYPVIIALIDDGESA